MVEEISETDDELLEKFLDGKEMSMDEMKQGHPRRNPGAKDFSDLVRLAAAPGRRCPIARCGHRLFAVAADEAASRGKNPVER